VVLDWLTLNESERRRQHDAIDYDQKCAEKDLALIEINIGWMVGLKTPINVVANSYMTPPE
jgi:hypothetical protein